MVVRVARSLPAVIWMAFIFAMSSQEQFPQTFGVSVFLLSIVAHLALYGILALLLLLAIDRNARPSRSTLLVAIAGAALYGVSDEIHQSFVPGRVPSVFDLAVNTFGATIAVVAWTYRRTIFAAVAFR